MKLILTRHGETEENKKQILQGHLPGKLSIEGINQAKKLAFRLKDEKIDVIYSSDLARAADTAEEIAKYHPHIKVNFVRELREIKLGAFEGKHKSAVDWNNAPSDAEAFEKVYERARKFLDEVYAKHKNDIVLFVAHGGINRALICYIQGKDYKHMREAEALKNTSISIFELKEDKKHIIHLLNCTKHLD